MVFMTQVSSDDVRHLAQLSSLGLSDDEISSLTSDIEAILNYVKQLDELDTDGVEPTYQVTDLENVWREDEIVPDETNADMLLGMATSTAEHQVKVPQVL